LLMLPAALVLFALVGYPLIQLVINGFFHIGPVGSGIREFVGLDNFAKALASPAVIGAGVRTVAYTFIVVTSELVLGVCIALLFKALGERSRALRTLFLYPLMIAPVVAGLLWRFVMIDDFGILNEILDDLGVIQSSSSIHWLSDVDIVLFSVAIPDIWLATSFVTLVAFAGLQNLPADVFEAARLDGANALQTFFRITLPLLRPVIAVILIVRGVDAARAFDVILIQTGGGPQFASEPLSLTIYRTMVRFGDVGYASAISTLFMIALSVFAVVGILTIWRPESQAREKVRR
jgi:multiple sugar transport system permease protein